jgi:hypothetical protein
MSGVALQSFGYDYDGLFSAFDSVSPPLTLTRKSRTLDFVSHIAFNNYSPPLTTLWRSIIKFIAHAIAMCLSTNTMLVQAYTLCAGELVSFYHSPRSCGY